MTLERRNIHLIHERNIDSLAAGKTAGKPKYSFSSRFFFSKECAYVFQIDSIYAVQNNQWCQQNLVGRNWGREQDEQD